MATISSRPQCVNKATTPTTSSGQVDHDDVIKWKHFPHYWPFVREINRSPVISPHKGQWRGALMFSLICLNKRLSKQWWGWWFDVPSCSLWRQCNDIVRNSVSCHRNIGFQFMMTSSNEKKIPCYSPVTGEFPSQRPVTLSFDVFFDLCLNKRDAIAIIMTS